MCEEKSRKYELVEEELDGVIMYRLHAIKNFGKVRKGDIGGLVSGENIIPHDDNSWVYKDSILETNVPITSTIIKKSKVIAHCSKLTSVNIFNSTIECTNTSLQTYATSIEDSEIYIIGSVVEFGNVGIYNTKFDISSSNIDIKQSIFNHCKYEYKSSEAIKSEETVSSRLVTVVDNKISIIEDIDNIKESVEDKEQFEEIETLSK